LSAKDLQGTRKAIRRVEVISAEETLGIFLTPTGSQDGQIRKLKHIQEWIDQIALGRLSRPELWTAVQSTIIRTLSYPLPALALSRKEWDHILSPLMAFVMPRLGICRYFPRALAFAPSNFWTGFRAFTHHTGDYLHQRSHLSHCQ
jgi:hypothetical protein